MLSNLRITAFLICLMMAANVYGRDADSLFSHANHNYENQDYSQALDGYLNLINQGYSSAPLYFNIGNCYFKEGKLGYAILYYLRAKRLNPNDDDINANLAFARQFMPTILEGVEVNPVTEFFDLVIAPFTLEIIAWISSVLFISFMLFLSVVIHMQFRGLYIKLTAYILFLLVIVSSGITTYKYRTEYLTKRGVIVSDEARVFSAPAEDSDLEFIGAFGLTFEIEKTTNEYYFITFENKRRGWIKKNNAEII